MTPEQISNWQDIVKDCQSNLKTINVGSEKRRKVIIAVAEELELLQPRSPFQIGQQVLNQAEAVKIYRHLKARGIVVAAGVDGWTFEDEILRRVLQNYIAVNGPLRE